jgi:hypothetical protein
MKGELRYNESKENVNGETSVIPQRGDLRFLEGTHVDCSGRVKEFRKHSSRRDLDSLCLVNVIVTPLPIGESLYLDHLWILRRQFKKIGIVPEQNERVHFSGKVYSYRRLGGKSLDRGIYGLENYGILPIEKNTGS